MTREEPLSSNHRQNLMEDFSTGQDGQHDDFCPVLPGKTSEKVVHADATEAGG